MAQKDAYASYKVPLQLDTQCRGATQKFLEANNWNEVARGGDLYKIKTEQNKSKQLYFLLVHL